MDHKVISINLLLSMFKGKEKPKIINCLKTQPLRFSELQKQLEPISKKVLSSQLHDLEEVGLIQRTVYPHKPIRIEYSITPLIKLAHPLFFEIKKWEDYYKETYPNIIKKNESLQVDHTFDLIIGLLGDKWKPQILLCLTNGKQRFSQIKKELFPISHRVLTQNLRDLEAYGFISRTVLDEKSPHVEYELTELCNTLENVGIEMEKFITLYTQFQAQKKSLD